MQSMRTLSVLLPLLGLASQALCQTPGLGFTTRDPKTGDTITIQVVPPTEEPLPISPFPPPLPQDSAGLPWFLDCGGAVQRPMEIPEGSPQQTTPPKPIQFQPGPEPKPAQFTNLEAPAPAVKAPPRSPQTPPPANTPQEKKTPPSATPAPKP